MASSARTLNGSGSIVMRADKVGADTLLARIVAMVAEAQRSRAPIQKLADRVSGYFVPAVVVVVARHLHRLGTGGPEPRLAARAGQRRRRPDHRLSVRARAWRRPCPSWWPPDARRAQGVLFRNAEAIELLGASTRL